MELEVIQTASNEYALRRRTSETANWEYKDLKAKYWWRENSEHYTDCFSKDRKLVMRFFDEHNKGESKIIRSNKEPEHVVKPPRKIPWYEKVFFMIIDKEDWEQWKKAI